MMDSIYFCSILNAGLVTNYLYTLILLLFLKSKPDFSNRIIIQKSLIHKCIILMLVSVYRMATWF